MAVLFHALLVFSPIIAVTDGGAALRLDRSTCLGLLTHARADGASFELVGPHHLVVVPTSLHLDDVTTWRRGVALGECARIPEEVGIVAAVVKDAGGLRCCVVISGAVSGIADVEARALEIFAAIQGTVNALNVVGCLVINGVNTVNRERQKNK